MKDLTTQTGIIVKCSKTAIEFFQNAQSVDFFSVLEIPEEFQGIAVEFYDLIMENDHLAALLSVILYEVDTENERLALHSIDIFADGRTRNIPDLYDGAIEITPIPTVEELNAHVWGEEFHACVIEQAEFEAAWESHTYDGALK